MLINEGGGMNSGEDVLLSLANSQMLTLQFVGMQRKWCLLGTAMCSVTQGRPGTFL